MAAVMEKRVQEAENTLHAHYQALLSAKQQQFDTILAGTAQAEQEQRQRWEQMMVGITQKQMTLQEEYEAHLRAKYEAYMRDWDQRWTEESNRWEQQALTFAETLANERRNAESRIRKMRIAASKWRSDYQQATKSQYDRLVTDLESHYTSLLEERSHTMADQHERTTVQLLVQQQQR